MLLRFMIGLLVSGILMAGWFGPIGTAVDEWRAAQLANTLKFLSRAATDYARMNCPGVLYFGTTPLPCSPSAWPTSWSQVAGFGIIPATMVTGGQILSPLDNASPISVGPVNGNAGSISVAIANAGIGQMVASRLPFSTYASGILTVPVLLKGTLGIWSQSSVGILNTNQP